MYTKKINKNLYPKKKDETWLPQALWQELSKKQFSKETITKKNKKSTKSTWWEISTKKL